MSLARITVIFGKNNSGKTTLTRLPLFIAASLSNAGLYALTSHGVRFGSSFSDIANRLQAHPSISYWLQADHGRRTSVELQSIRQGFEEHIVLSSYSIGDSASGQLPLLEPLPTEMQEAVREARSVASALSPLIHIPSARADIATAYEARKADGVSIADVPYLLHENRELEDSVSNWFDENLDGISLSVERSSYSFRLVHEAVDGAINYASLGRGTQALVPIVALVKAIDLGLVVAPLMIVEEPEVHLHPSLHGAVADLLASISDRTQIIVETHSENFILRLRRRIAARELPTEAVRLAYVSDERQLVNIEVDEHGAVSTWPIGVFEYDLDEARAIVEARVAAMDEIDAARTL